MSDILDRIDADIQAWEARPESWLPGDPLYDHPYQLGQDAQTVRPMFQLVDDWAPPARCRPCGVSWSDDEPCWVCGVERPPVFPSGSVAALLLRMGRLDDYGRRISQPPMQLPSFANAIRAAADMEQAMDRLRQVVEADLTASLEQLYARVMTPPPLTPPRLTGPSPLPVDGHAYRRRTRRRTNR